MCQTIFFCGGVVYILSKEGILPTSVGVLPTAIDISVLKNVFPSKGTKILRTLDDSLSSVQRSNDQAVCVFIAQKVEKLMQKDHSSQEAAFFLLVFRVVDLALNQAAKPWFHQYLDPS